MQYNIFCLIMIRARLEDVDDTWYQIMWSILPIVRVDFGQWTKVAY